MIKQTVAVNGVIFQDSAQETLTNAAREHPRGGEERGGEGGRGGEGRGGEGGEREGRGEGRKINLDKYLS